MPMRTTGSKIVTKQDIEYYKKNIKKVIKVQCVWISRKAKKLVK